MADPGRWVAVGVPDKVTHGGSLRARYLFRSLIERTNALAFYRPDPSVIHRMLRRPLHLLPEPTSRPPSSYPWSPSRSPDASRAFAFSIFMIFR